MFRRPFTAVRTVRLPATLIACLALASAANAEQSDQGSPSDALRAQAERLIEASDGGAFLVSEDHAPAIGIRHTRSGLLCRFTEGQRNEVRIRMRSGTGIARGDDVSCLAPSEVGAFALSATRAPAGRTADEALSDAMRTMRRLHGEARELTAAELAPAGHAPPQASRTSAIIITMDGREYIFRASAYVSNGWAYSMQFTSHMIDRNDVADQVWATALNDLTPPATAAH